ncbi:hypothetical protein GZH47_15970 [Paenibacillus rhizovicinus]|uniref:Uncharacterized protein n=1 Tax=Paenibacillus rhizovicinus TaxID=2704463 RepID=A0A6C0P2U8_9BACL|nr:hypothetical protein [Paenibacillus rhizovicinus]QHW32153.1 hypothetical protein GZH47_15970 [Paenibacillus rhizovicinus]
MPTTIDFHTQGIKSILSQYANIVDQLAAIHQSVDPALLQRVQALQQIDAIINQILAAYTAIQNAPDVVTIDISGLIGGVQGSYAGLSQAIKDRIGEGTLTQLKTIDNVIKLAAAINEIKAFIAEASTYDQINSESVHAIILSAKEIYTAIAAQFGSVADPNVLAKFDQAEALINGLQQLAILIQNPSSIDWTVLQSRVDEIKAALNATLSGLQSQYSDEINDVLAKVAGYQAAFNELQQLINNLKNVGTFNIDTAEDVVDQVQTAYNNIAIDLGITIDENDGFNTLLNHVRDTIHMVQLLQRLATDPLSLTPAEIETSLESLSSLEDLYLSIMNTIHITPDQNVLNALNALEAVAHGIQSARAFEDLLGGFLADLKDNPQQTLNNLWAAYNEMVNNGGLDYLGDNQILDILVNAETTAVNAVNALIDGIHTPVKLSDLASIASIIAARPAYNALSDHGKTLVGGERLAKLENAEVQMLDLKYNLLAAKPSKGLEFLYSKSTVQGYVNDFNALDYNQQTSISAGSKTKLAAWATYYGITITYKVQ